MTAADGFPRELLKEPKATRLAYFSRYTVAHPLLKDVDAKLWQALASPGDARLICSATQCEKMAGEMLEGEGQLAEGQEAKTRLRLLLGLPEKPGRQEVEVSEQKRISGRVGQRRAGRDPIGGKQRASGSG